MSRKIKRQKKGLYYFICLDILEPGDGGTLDQAIRAAKEHLDADPDDGEIRIYHHVATVKGKPEPKPKPVFEVEMMK